MSTGCTTAASGGPLSSDSSKDDWDGPCSCCTMTQYSKRGLEAVERESNDN